MRRTRLALALAPALALPCLAYMIPSVELGALLREADVAAYVRIVAADGDTCKPSIYKAKVIEAFKGTVRDEYIYIGGAYVSDRAGLFSRQIVFLKRASATVTEYLGPTASTSCPSTFAPSAPVFKVMYEGYSVLPVRYTSDLPRGDDGVEVCYTQVILPEDLFLVRQEHYEGASVKAWIHLADLLQRLRQLVAEPTPTATPKGA